ncbi:MAG: 1-phosphofructokinase family hexose kinase [Candidatus Firestonebacteria bacterium]
MILNVGLNPVWQKTLEIDNLKLDSVNRVKNVIEMASGKGINVARSLKILGESSFAIGFAGGTNGSILVDYLRNEKISHNFVKTIANTRMAITLVDEKAHSCTEIVEPATNITTEEKDRFFKIFNETISRTKMLTLSGTIPKGISDNIYFDLIRKASTYGIKTILDTGGKTLAFGIKAKPYMIKPNLLELEMMLECKLNTVSLIKTAVRKFLSIGIEWVAISLGKKGAIVGNKDKIWHAIPPKIDAINPIGSGDAMTAGFVYGLSKNNRPEDIIKLGIACGSANALISGPGIFDINEAHKLTKRVHLILL